MANKLKLSMTLSKGLNHSLEELAELYQLSKSALVEKILQEFIEKRLEQEGKILAKAKFDDLPTEDEWAAIESWPHF